MTPIALLLCRRSGQTGKHHGLEGARLFLISVKRGIERGSDGKKINTDGGQTSSLSKRGLGERGYRIEKGLLIRVAGPT